MLLPELESALCIGDIVFTRIHRVPFRQIAEATGAWTNHVGVVVGFGRNGAVIAESRVPLSCHSRFSRFVRRSEQRRVAVLRLPRPLTEREIARLQRAAGRRLGRIYDTGFNLGSPRRQFCSRFVREVVEEATDENLGEVTTFAELLAKNPEVDLRLWKAWYFGKIPWARATVTPASLYRSPALRVVFDGQVQRGSWLRGATPMRGIHPGLAHSGTVYCAILPGVCFHRNLSRVPCKNEETRPCPYLCLIPMRI
jgi:hypothetical protein